MLIKTKDFSKSGFRLPLPYLLSLQKESWKTFCTEGLKELFSEISPIKGHTKKDLELWFLDYKLGEPKYKDGIEARKNNDSFDAPLRVKIKLVNHRNKEEKTQEVFLGDIPLLTEKGTFVVNGVERVVISQLIRSPGAFFTCKKIKGKNYFGAKLIPGRGSWLEFQTEKNGFIGIKIDRKRKVAATTLLKAFGFETNEKIRSLFKDIPNGVKNIEETLKRDFTKGQNDALIDVYKRLRPGDMASPEAAKELIENMFFNFERYDFSRVGRWKIRQRLPGSTKNKDKEVTISDRILKPKDIVEVVKEIIRLNNNPEAEPDQIDHLGNRRIRTLSELLQNRLRVGLVRTGRIIKDRMSTMDNYDLSPAQLINPRPFMAIIKEFFLSSQMSQFMDNENPLSELEHKRRLSATGPGGLTKKRAGFEVRDVQPSHYGRICPIQTPESSSIGLVGHLATFAKVNDYGFIETPYFKVKNGKATSEICYLNAYEEERCNIAPGSTIVDKNGIIKENRPEARIKSRPGSCLKKDIDYMDVAPEQSISVATSLIPFLQNDDANRALMGSNMQRQAVPLFKPTTPLVLTGTEANVARDSGRVIIAEYDGIVTEVDGEHIRVRSTKNKESNKKTSKTYPLMTFVDTNQCTCFHQSPIVIKGQKVKKGDILSNGGSIVNGHLSLGQNLLVAFVSWRGASFEDAIIISERLVKEDVYTSVNMDVSTCDVRETKLGPEVITSDIPNVSEEKLKNLDEDGIIVVGTEIGPGDILVGKISPKGETSLTAEEKLLRAIFGEKAREVKDTSLRVEHGKRGRVVGVKVFSRKEGHKLDIGVIQRIEVRIAQMRKIQIGDKLAGRHGNKGVISTILPQEDMPFLEDGTPVDIVLNPLSVASRMNLGQILETHLGLAAKKLDYHAVTPALTGANEKDIMEELKKAGIKEDGKVKLFDGRTGIAYPQRITVGYAYMMKLIHMVEDKIHTRSIGPYSLITQQPLRGRAQFGGQRFGEMEVWALEGYGAAHTLQEMLTIKSDDLVGRASAYEAILKGEKIKKPNLPASFDLLVAELKALGLDFEIQEE